MPVTIMSWFSADNAPRTSVGAISERHRGTIRDAVPTARPSTADYMTGASLLVDGACSLFQFDEE